MYYHVTPRRNVRRILSEGLRPSGGDTLRSWNEDPTGEVIFLGRSSEESLYNLWNTRINNPEDTARFKGWTLLGVDLPSNWPLEEDPYGFLFTREHIPSRYIQVIESEIKMKDIFEMDKSGSFQRWHEEVF